KPGFINNTHRFYRKQKTIYVLFSGLPCVTFCNASTTYNTMYMRMKTQLLSPGVQHTDNTRRRTQIFRRVGEAQKRLSRCIKEQLEQQLAVTQHHASQLMR